MLITPEYVFKDVTHITPEWLAAKGITAQTAVRSCRRRWPRGLPPCAKPG